MYVSDRNAPSTCPTAPAFLVMKSPYMLNNFGGSVIAFLVWSAAFLRISMSSSASRAYHGALMFVTKRPTVEVFALCDMSYMYREGFCHMNVAGK